MKKTKKKQVLNPIEMMVDYEFLNKLVVAIGEVAKITGIPQRQLRYWEQKGIIKADEQPASGSTRRFNYLAIKKIILIKEFLDEGYTLEAAAKKVEDRIKKVKAVVDKFKKVSK